MQPTARQTDQAKHPLKPTNRRPPRTQRQTWYLAMSGCILAAILVLGFILYWINRPVDITVNGKRSHVRIGSTTTELFEEKSISVTPGNLMSINGRMLEEGAGHAFSVPLNDNELSPEDGEQYRIQGGERIEFLNGADIVEDYDVVEESTAPELAFYGTGTTIEYVMQWGRAGTIEHRTGKVSHETADVETVEPTPCIIARTDLLLDEDKKFAAITFDDGPADPYTEQYLQILKRYNVKATFFNLGENAQQYPELAKRVVQEGHELANHTMAHNQLTSVSASTIRSEIERSAKVLADVSGVVTTHIRPPYGDFGESSWLASGGTITASIRWNGDSQDWRVPGVEAMVENALLNVRPGSIILMHDGGGDRSQDVEALPLIIERLQRDGYTLVTIADLMRASGKIPEDICSGTTTMPTDATWPQKIAPAGYMESYIERLEQEGRQFPPSIQPPQAPQPQQPSMSGQGGTTPSEDTEQQDEQEQQADADQQGEREQSDLLDPQAQEDQQTPQG